MGYYGKIELKQKAQEMRKRGKSYNEIMKVLKLSKSTVSDWCKDVELTKQQKYNLYQSKRRGALKGSYIAAQNKKSRRKIATEQLFVQGVQEIGTMNRRERFIAGIMLYASEGTKIDKGCCFSNSDPKMIKFMVKWFKEFGAVNNDRMRGAIWLHENLNEKEAKNFWASVTKIPLDHFYKTYIAKDKIKSKKIRKNKHNYGVFSLYINDISLLRKIMGWIDGVLRYA